MTPNPGLRAWRASICAMAITLTGCSGETIELPDAQWLDLQVHVEARSYGPMPAMKELLVFVTRRGVVPAWDCRVDLRTSDADPWKQAIEDGRVGVYRRAAVVDDMQHSVLQIWIHAQGKQTVLRIPLTPQAASAAGARTNIDSTTLEK